MLTFCRTNNARRGSNFALAIALMAGTALGVGAFAVPAHAQKRTKGGEEKASKANYTKAFIAIYTQVNALITGDGANPAAAAAKIPEVLAEMKTDDDKNAAGGLIFNIGRDTKNTQLQLQGLGLMVDSGKNDEKKVGQFTYTAYQIHRELGQFAEARASLQAAIDAKHSFTGNLADGTSRTFGPADLQVMMSELYFDQEDFEGGLKYLQNIIDSAVAAGGKPDEAWIRRGFSVAYNNDLANWALSLSTQYVKFYPSPEIWGNALAVQRNLLEMDNNVMVDVMRLADRTGVMKTGRDYVEYIDAADARRLPGEVERIVKQGIQAGVLNQNEAFVKEVQETVRSRIAADKADLPSLEADARKAGATALTATAAGDVLLSYNMAAKAEEMYAIAATKSGADLNRIYTRMGIAQVDQGKTDQAVASFAKVGGGHAQIAKLWSIYAQNKAASAPATSM